MSESRVDCPLCNRKPGETHLRRCSRWRLWCEPRGIDRSRTYIFPERLGRRFADLVQATRKRRGPKPERGDRWIWPIDPRRVELRSINEHPIPNRIRNACKRDRRRRRAA